jgi:hypothetical protein
MMAERSDEFDDAAAAASYVASMVAELAVIARHHGFRTLGYLLEMARLEAENAKRRSNGGRNRFTGSDRPS